MKTVNLRPHLKRNILIAAVLLLVCAAAFLNWSYNQRWGDGNSAMADAEDEMTTAVNAADGAPEETVSDYEDKITFLKFALEQYNHFDEDREIPDSVLEAFVEKIVIFEDHFEWYLRFGSPGGPTKCGVNGKANENPTVWGEGDDPSPAGLSQDKWRQVRKTF